MPGREPRTIAVVTSSRADYGHLVWPLRELLAFDHVTVRLIVTGGHLAAAWGETADVIERDGFHVAHRVECHIGSDADAEMGRAIGRGTTRFTDLFEQERPDLLLLVADRFEMLAPAAAALALRIPIAHVEGGDVSEGAIDHAVRNALTAMSHVHFTPTATAARRLMLMGEEPWRVHHVGTPSLDHLRRSPLWTAEEVGRRLDIDVDRPFAVVGFHPVTLDRETTTEADAVFDALGRVDLPLVFCHPNADAGSYDLMRRIETLVAERDDVRRFVNLDPVAYWSLLRNAAVMIGNSSSGIMESPSLRVPAVNIGRRQQGREQAVNVIDVPADADAIVGAVNRAMSADFRAGLSDVVNPYGDGATAPRIARVLSEVPIDERLLEKRARAIADIVGDARDGDGRAGS